MPLPQAITRVPSAGINEPLAGGQIRFKITITMENGASSSSILVCTDEARVLLDDKSDRLFKIVRLIHELPSWKDLT